MFCSNLIPRSSPSAIRRKNIKFNETYNYYFVFFLAVTKGRSSNVIKTCREASRQSRRWSGECPKALYREDIGYIDIVWGENDPKTNRGFGLKHIVEKHGANINELGFEVEDFIPIVVQFGNLSVKKSDNKKQILESATFRIVIQTRWDNQEKVFLLTAFDLRKKPE